MEAIGLMDVQLRAFAVEEERRRDGKGRGGRGSFEEAAWARKQLCLGSFPDSAALML